jgi:protein-tyrosine kinase
MRFGWRRRRLHDRLRELRTRGEACPDSRSGKIEIAGSAALLSAPDAIDCVTKPQSDVRSAPIELAVHSQNQKLERTRRRLARNLVIGAGASSEASFAFNRLGTQIVGRLRDNGWNTVAITSPSKGSGSTLTAINLAISIADGLSSSVALVELDFVNPTFHKFLGFEQRQGIVDYLLDDVPIPEILINPGIDRLVVIPAGSPPNKLSELFASPRMFQLVAALKLDHQHRIVLFDLPSVLASDHAIAFSRLVDCVLLVVAEGETRVYDVRRALDYLGSTNILGVVLNRSLSVASDGA